MSATPILDDLDMNFSEIKKGRLENVTLLPTGLNNSHKGYSVYFNHKIWVWDGTRWNTWNNLLWSDERNEAIDHLTPRNETTPVNITSRYLGGTVWNINLSEGYDDGMPRTLGTIHFIGDVTEIDDWSLITGRRFVYTARNGSWFNIKNLSQNSVPDNHKRINTGTNTDLFKLVKAEFSFDAFLDAWILVSFERKKNWFKRFEIPETPADTTSIIVGNIPSSSTEGLPYNGLYHVDVYIEVVEYRETMLPMYTQFSQKLEISAPGDSWITIDSSGHFNQAVGVPSGEWFNNSLQGSAIIFVNEPVCGNRDITWRVTLPNGTYKQILGGYMHIKYLGEIEGEVCTS